MNGEDVNSNTSQPKATLSIPNPTDWQAVATQRNRKSLYFKADFQLTVMRGPLQADSHRATSYVLDKFLYLNYVSPIIGNSLYTVIEAVSSLLVREDC
jgi:hypothetical protein